MIRVMLAVNNEQANFEGYLRAFEIFGWHHAQVEGTVLLTGDPIPCRFERALRTWHRGTIPLRPYTVEHQNRFVWLRNALFVVGDPGKEWALPVVSRTMNVGNVCWDSVWVDDRHVGDLVSLIAYLCTQDWTCEEATVPLMELWDTQNWKELQLRLEDVCGSDRHTTTF